MVSKWNLVLDPETKAWLEQHKHQVFGFPTLVRFSWGTCTSHFKDIVEVLWSVLISLSIAILQVYIFFMAYCLFICVYVQFKLRLAGCTCSKEYHHLIGSINLKFCNILGPLSFSVIIMAFIIGNKVSLESGWLL